MIACNSLDRARVFSNLESVNFINHILSLNTLVTPSHCINLIEIKFRIRPILINESSLLQVNI
jgi:hypothetical protein